MESNGKFFIITNGAFSTELLEKALPSNILKNSQFVPSMGYDSALSKAKSLAVRLKNQIILLLDSGTKNDNETRYKKEQVEFVLKNLVKEGQVKVFIFQPEIEIIFFEDENLKKSLFNRKLIQEESPFQPLKKSIVNPAEFVSKLNEEDIKLLQQNTSLKKVIELYTTMSMGS